jgi:hypothetical protein
VSSYKDESSYEKSMGLNTGFIGKGLVPGKDIDDSKFSEILRGIVSQNDVQNNQPDKNDSGYNKKIIFKKKMQTYQQTMDLIHGGLFLKKVNQKKMPSIRCKETIHFIKMIHGGCYADASLSEKKLIDSDSGTKSIRQLASRVDNYFIQNLSECAFDYLKQLYNGISVRYDLGIENKWDSGSTGAAFYEGKTVDWYDFILSKNQNTPKTQGYLQIKADKIVEEKGLLIFFQTFFQGSDVAILEKKWLALELYEFMSRVLKCKIIHYHTNEMGGAALGDKGFSGFAKKWKNKKKQRS